MSQKQTKSIYAVRTENFNDTLFYKTKKEATDFVGDQRNMDFATSMEKRRVSKAEFDRLMASMELPDGQGVRD